MSGPAVDFPSLTEGEVLRKTEGDRTELVPVPFLDGPGIDRLSISFPVLDVAEAERWNKVETRADGSWRRTATMAPYVGGPGIMVGVQMMSHGEVWAKAEANPARFSDPDGCSLLNPRDGAKAIEVMFRAACELVRPVEDSADLARLRRVDVARDFRGVTNTALYVRGLGPIKRPYARRSFTYNDPARGSAQTLFVGSGAGGVRLYDQHEAYAAKGAPEGSLRWEVEARTGWLESLGVRRAGELDAGVVDVLARERWEWSRMGTSVSGPVSIVEAVSRWIDTGKVSRSVGERLIGRVVMQSLGVATAGSNDSEARYNKLARDLSIVPSPDLWNNELAAQAIGRLDFETGLEELALTGS